MRRDGRQFAGLMQDISRAEIIRQVSRAKLAQHLSGVVPHRDQPAPARIQKPKRIIPGPVGVKNFGIAGADGIADRPPFFGIGRARRAFDPARADGVSQRGALIGGGGRSPRIERNHFRRQPPQDAAFDERHDGGAAHARRPLHGAAAVRIEIRGHRRAHKGTQNADSGHGTLS